MKKLVLIIMAVIGFAGMSVAQDVYYSGYYRTSSGHIDAAVYQNGSRLYYANGNPNLGVHTSSDVDVYDGDVYWVWNCMDNGNYQFAEIKKNGTSYLVPSGSAQHIFDLQRASNGNLYAVGAMEVNGVRTAVQWRNNNPDPYVTMGSGNYKSEAYGCTEAAGQIYTCGYEYTSSNSFRGVIWYGTSRFHIFDTFTMIFDITYRDGYIYSVGYYNEHLTVWKTYIPDGGTTTVLYTLGADSPGLISIGGENNNRIYIDDAGDIYVTGGGHLESMVWKNGSLYAGGTNYSYTSVLANTDGVYMSGSYDEEEGKIWKDYNVLFSPNNCDMALNIYIDEPECTETGIRDLPFTEGFENGNTSWPCWTSIDYDGNNAGSQVQPYWGRTSGRNNISPYDGNYYAYHGWCANQQEGWLVSPRLHLQSGQSSTTLTFKSNMVYTNYGDYRGVWISTTGINTSSFTEVWALNVPTGGWQTVTIDLSAYQGQNVYIAFKTRATNGIGWCIDNVSVTETPPTQYTITANANNNSWGTVTGGGNYAPGATCVLHATPNTGYVFQNWKKNGTIVSTNPNYSFTVTESATYTAYFGEAPVVYYDITTNVTPAGAGTVTGGGQHPAGSSITLTANNNPGWTFAHWQDGNTANPRTITVTGDAIYTATFTHDQYQIAASVSPAGTGTVTGGGGYYYGDVATLTATANSGYVFQGWQDGNAQNPRTITVTGNATYTAYFTTGSVITHTLTVMCNTSEGTVSGGGIFVHGASAIVQAFPNPGYAFTKWSDENTQNPRTIIVKDDMTLVAYFATGVDENPTANLKLYPNPAKSTLRIAGLEAETSVQIYNSLGELVKVVSMNADEEIDVSDLATGLYLLRCGSTTLRFVKEQ